MSVAAANSPDTGRPCSRMSACWRSNIARSAPLRRWVGSTPAHVSPRMGTARPPGTVIWNGWSTLTPIISPPSKAATQFTR